MALKRHKASPWAKAIYVVILAVTLIVIWAAVRSFDTAPPADPQPLVPPAESGGKQ